MKKCLNLLAASGLIACAALLSSSCNKQDPVQPTITIECYTAGNEFDANSNPTPVIYKDAQQLYKLESGCEVKGVVYIGGDIFACGNNVSNGTVVFWKNGQVANLGGSTVKGELKDMVGNGTDWYCCGYVLDGYTRSGIILKNGVEFFRGPEGTEYTAIDLGASGDCYVTSMTGVGVELLRIDKAGSGVKEIRTITKDEKFVPTDLYVGLQDFVVSLNYRTVDGDTAYCWVSTFDAPIRLTDKNSQAWSAAIFNGNFFIGGCIDSSDAKPFAVQWVNTAGEDFSYGCNPEYSCVKLLRNGGYHLYEAVESKGLVQICANGQGLFDITCSDNFSVTAWDIVRVK